MDEFRKKLFVQLDDDFPGVRVQALDALRDHLKKAGQSFRDIVLELENAIPLQKHSDLQKLYDKAVQDNAGWAQRDQLQAKQITELSRKIALYKGLAALHLNWGKLVAWPGLLVAGWFGFQYITAPSWPDNATPGLRSMVNTVVWGQWFEKPFINVIGGNAYWIMLRGEIDKTSYASNMGSAVVMRCLHVFAVPATAENGEYRRPYPYGWFGNLQWPERLVQCAPAPTQEASR